MMLACFVVKFILN